MPLFPLEWGKVNVVPTHKKRDKQILPITVPYLSFSLQQKHLKRYFETKISETLCNNIYDLQKMIQYFTTNQDLNQVIRVFTNFCRLLMK